MVSPKLLTRWTATAWASGRSGLSKNPRHRWSGVDADPGLGGQTFAGTHVDVEPMVNWLSRGFDMEPIDLAKPEVALALWAGVRKRGAAYFVDLPWRIAE